MRPQYFFFIFVWLGILYISTVHARKRFDTPAESLTNLVDYHGRLLIREPPLPNNREIDSSYVPKSWLSWYQRIMSSPILEPLWKLIPSIYQLKVAFPCTMDSSGDRITKRRPPRPRPPSPKPAPPRNHATHSSPPPPWPLEPLGCDKGNPCNRFIAVGTDIENMSRFHQDTR